MAGVLNGPVILLTNEEFLREVLASAPLGSIVEVHHEDCGASVTGVADDCNCTPTQHLAGVRDVGARA